MLTYGSFNNLPKKNFETFGRLTEPGVLNFFMLHHLKDPKQKEKLIGS